ncbi:hypothetical protein QAD02_004786 [Eretmocerus hayati]|uniref:Uncharacterized protein n=1 Tax=Eretmocerus hayati TaxID=131215 RepID=A0ACC2NQK2_9HYME|nr:hypothetical protein QAD02_004786 [Eretmocerus hayati]
MGRKQSKGNSKGKGLGLGQAPPANLLKTLRSSNSNLKPIETQQKVKEHPTNVESKQKEDKNKNNEEALVAEGGANKSMQFVLDEMLKKQEDQMKEFKGILGGNKRKCNAMNDVDEVSSKNVKTEHKVQDALVVYLNNQFEQMGELMSMLKSGELKLGGNPEENDSVEEASYQIDVEANKTKGERGRPPETTVAATDAGLDTVNDTLQLKEHEYGYGVLQ